MSDFISLIDYKAKIDSAITNIKNEYFYIGFLLNEIKIYSPVDFSITDWCYDNFGFKKSFTYQLINVFNLISDNGSMYISKKYEGYNFSQLSELLSVPDHLKNQFDNTMSVREIKEKKKILSGYLKDDNGNWIKTGSPECESDEVFQTSGKNIASEQYDFVVLENVHTVENKTVSDVTLTSMAYNAELFKKYYCKEICQFDNSHCNSCRIKFIKYIGYDYSLIND